MTQSLGIEALISKRNDLIADKKATIERFNIQISDIETCIELLAGKKVWEVVKEERFDDENPNYIKASFED